MCDNLYNIFFQREKLAQLTNKNQNHLQFYTLMMFIHHVAMAWCLVPLSRQQYSVLLQYSVYVNIRQADRLCKQNFSIVTPLAFACEKGCVCGSCLVIPAHFNIFLSVTVETNISSVLCVMSRMHRFHFSLTKPSISNFQR